ncbi:MAG: lysylphosphatidylglycerol synthase transmembrane domain-containing protein [Candidatus Methanomethyliaceae archaeon]
MNRISFGTFWNHGLLIACVAGVSLLAITLWLARPSWIFIQIQSLGALGFATLFLNFSLGFICNAKGWEYLLRAQGIHPPFSTVLQISCASYALGYLIPSFNLAGEPIRVVLATKELGVGKRKVVSTVLAEKLLFTGIIATFLMGAAVTIMNMGLPPVIHQGLFSVAGAGLALTIATVGGLLVGMPRWIHGVLYSFPSLVSSSLLQALWAAATDMRSNLCSRRLEFLIAGLAIAAGVGFNALTPLLFFFFVSGQILPLQTLASLFGLNTVFSLSFWVPPAGLGVTEGAYAGTFSVLGLPVDQAVAFAFVQRIGVLPILGLGLFYLTREGVLSRGRRSRDG